MEARQKKFKGIRKRWMVNSISVVLLIVLLAVTALSWVYSLVRKISAIMERRRREKEKEEILIQRVREAGRNGGGIVHIDDLQD